MRNFILSILIAFVANTSFAQTFNMTWSEQQKFPEGDDYIEKILYADKDNFFFDYTTRGFKNEFLKVDFHTVNKMPTDFKSLKSERIFLDKKAQGDWETGNDLTSESKYYKHNIKSIAVKDGFFTLLLNEESKNENTYGYIKYSSNGTHSDIKPIITVAKKDLSSYNSLNAFTSSDSSKVAIIIEREYENKVQKIFAQGRDLIKKQKTFNVIVLNNDGSLVWKNSFKIEDGIENDTHISDIILSPDGNILLYSKKYEYYKLKKDNDVIDSNVSGLLHLISNNGKNMQKIDIPNVSIGLKYENKNDPDDIGRPSSKINVSKMFFHNNNFVYVTSYNNNLNFPQGLIYMEINQDGKIIKNIKSPLPQNYISAMIQDENTSEKKTERQFIVINNILINSKNEIIILAENASVYKYKSINNNGTYGTTITTTRLYLYRDMYCIKLNDKDNELNYFARIDKIQLKGHPDAETYSCIFNNKLYVFRINNDSFNDFVIPIKDKDIKIGINSQDFVVDIIDDNGNFTTKSIYKKSEKDRLIYPSDMKAIAPNKFLFMAANTKGRGWFQSIDYFGTIEIKE